MNSKNGRKSLEGLNLPIIGEEPGIIKYRTANGNDFSVTFENNRVIYMENDWLLHQEGSQLLFSDFVFGKTSLKDIRDKYGSNGFAFTNRTFSATETHMVAFNCFEFDSEKNEILVTITGISMDDMKVNENNISERMLLLALIIADKSYLDKIWGEEKAFDGNYKKIRP